MQSLLCILNSVFNCSELTISAANGREKDVFKAPFCLPDPRVGQQLKQFYIQVRAAIGPL